jgi:hypothetical protein
MRIITLKLVVWVALGLVLLCPAVSRAMDIVPNYDPNMTQQQRDIIDQKITLWEERLCCSIVLNIDFSNASLGGLLASPPPAEPGVEFLVGRLPSGEWQTWAATDSFRTDDQGRPAHARIRFNNNPAVNWHYGGEPVPAGTVDFWTIVNHEICHAAGFTVAYPSFAAQVVGPTNPDGTRPFNCAGVTSTLTHDSLGTHLDPTAHPGDLMNPFYEPGDPRRTPSPLDIAMLRCIWPCESGENTSSRYATDAPIEVPAPGDSIVIPFNLDISYPHQQLFVYFSQEFGGGAYAILADYGSVSMQGVRRAIPGQEHIVDLHLQDSYLVGSSVNIPYFGETGLNILQYDYLSGTFDLNTGQVGLMGSGTIVNDLFDSTNPIIVQTLQQGELDIYTGELLMTTRAEDLIPVIPCEYVVGDVNGSDSFNGLDIVYGVSYFKGGPYPGCEPCALCPDWSYCGDVNGSCSYNGLDITYGVNYFKGIVPPPIPCPECPPAGE